VQRHGADGVVPEKASLERLAYFQQQGTKVYRSIRKKRVVHHKAAPSGSEGQVLMQMSASDVIITESDKAGNEAMPEDQVGTISRSKEKSAEDMAVTDHSEADLGVAAKAHQFATSTVVAAEKRRTKEKKLAEARESANQEAQQRAEEKFKKGHAEAKTQARNKNSKAGSKLEKAQEQALNDIANVQAQSAAGTKNGNTRLLKLHTRLAKNTQQLSKDQAMGVKQLQDFADRAQRDTDAEQHKADEMIATTKLKAKKIVDTATAKSKEPAAMKKGATMNALEEAQQGLSSFENDAKSHMDILQDKESTELKIQLKRAKDAAAAIVAQAKNHYEIEVQDSHLRRKKASDDLHAELIKVDQIKAKVKVDAKEALIRDVAQEKDKLQVVKDIAEGKGSVALTMLATDVPTTTTTTTTTTAAPAGLL